MALSVKMFSVLVAVEAGPSVPVCSRNFAREAVRPEKGCPAENQSLIGSFCFLDTCTTTDGEEHTTSTPGTAFCANGRPKMPQGPFIYLADRCPESHPRWEKGWCHRTDIDMYECFGNWCLRKCESYEKDGERWFPVTHGLYCCTTAGECNEYVNNLIGSTAATAVKLLESVSEYTSENLQDLIQEGAGWLQQITMVDCEGASIARRELDIFQSELLV